MKYILFCLLFCSLFSVALAQTSPGTIDGTLSLCEGTTTDLSDSTTGGSWTSSNTAVATIGSAGTVTGVSSGTTTISYTTGSGSATAVVTVYASPVVTVTPSVSPTVCLGNSTTFFVSTSSTSNILTQDFNTTLGAWTVDNTGTTSTSSLAAWQIKPDGYFYGTSWHSPDNTPFVITNADNGGAGSRTVTKLISPTFSLAGYSTATLSFQQSYSAYADDSFAVVQISTDGGTSWTTLHSYTGTTSGTSASFASASINMNTYAGMSGLKIRFYYNSLWGFQWAIDNVIISGTSTPGIAWTGIDGATGLSCSTCDTTIITPTTAGDNTYEVTVSAGYCSISDTVTVHVDSLPGVIGGPSLVCTGSSVTLSTSSTGGAWSSGNTSVASIGSGSGIASGVAVGTSSISYTGASGCVRTKILTVSATPASITGSLTACVGSSSVLSNSTVGGSWSSTDPSVATIDSTGIVSGLSPGTAIVSYVLASSCYATAVITVNDIPAAISGDSTICLGATTALSDATTGGQWTSGSPSVASVGSASGVVTGVSAGSAEISYTQSGCSVVHTLTVDGGPGSISGSTGVCIGLTTSLSTTTSGGAWSVGDTAVASIDEAGIITGISTGTTGVTYTATTGCFVTTVVTVNSLPDPISGVAVLCQGSVTTLSSASSGGSWATADTSVATITGGGTLTGISPGTTTVTYSLGSGCLRTLIVTVNALPSDISGTLSVCTGSTTALSDATSGGASWSSSSIAIATIAGSGVATGISAGTTHITYTLTTGCYTTSVLTVNPLPATISGSLISCPGLSTTLSCADAGGTWSSASPGVGSVAPTSGIVTCAAAGTMVVTYTLPTGCIRTATVTVNTPPASISGLTTVCAGSDIVLSCSTTGGAWSSSNTGIATIGSASGIVTGVAAGAVSISYTIASTCFQVTTITVNTAVPSITGPSVVCMGAVISLTDAATGGTWSSSNTAIATVAGGIVTSIAPGTVNISYTTGSGCYAVKSLTVNAAPPSITGPSSVCVGSVITLANAESGGSWISGDTSTATISSSGVVTGITGGIAAITYTSSSGCAITRNITVNTLPPAIAGTLGVCEGNTTVLSCPASGGVSWTSSNTSVATIGSSSGLVTAVAPGTSTITFLVSSGCTSTTTLTVNANPAAISGTFSICAGTGATLSDGTTGGIWTSSNTTVAVVGSSSGAVSGVLSGTAVISYQLSTGCRATEVVTVVALPAPISGASSLCSGSTATLSSATPAGTWSSSAPSVATISSSGLVTAVATGTSTITYTAATGCYRTSGITVGTALSSITTPSPTCTGSSATFTNPTGGGAWSSNNTSVVTINPGTGVATCLSAGSAIITYTLSAGCYASSVVTVNASTPSITGVNSACEGASSAMAIAVSGGSWSTNSATIATVSGSGLVTGITSGTCSLSYTMPSGCFSVRTFTVNALPSGISGSLNVCVGNTTALSCSGTGGASWSSSNASVATIAGSGVVTGISPGTAIISYQVATGCLSTAIVSVNSTSATISGTGPYCVGTSGLLYTTESGGTWTSTNTSVATVGSVSGLVSAISSGTALISYALPTGCTITAVATVSPLPASISGSNVVCVGSSTMLSTTTTGGSWISSNTSVASVSPDGLVTGLATGTTAIQYLLPTGCYVSATVTVNTAIPPITGTATICAGLTTTLSDAVSGGSWSSSSSIATVSASGVVTGLAGGTVFITYATSAGCTTTRVVTVTTSPAAITGSAPICVGSTITLADADAGGTWTSGTPTAASISSGGVVTGIAAGTSRITYALSSSCKAFVYVTVNPIPAAISGLTTLCVGSTASMGSAPSGGTWSSSNPLVISISASGMMSPLSTGTSTISYTLSTGCSRSVIVTVNPTVPPITGIATVCAGLTTTLSNLSAGGTWSSSYTPVASVSSTSGVVTGGAGGTATITYTLSAACTATRVVTITTSPAAITGSGPVCVGSTITLSSADAGGTWTSGTPTAASISSGGVVTGLAYGTTLITYALSPACKAYAWVNVNALPATIVGSTLLCEGATATIGSATPGGVWSSSIPSVATISASGLVSAISSGTSAMSYTLATGCMRTTVVTVSAALADNTGTPETCIGLSTTLSNSTPGGTWTTSLPGVALVSDGVVTGHAAGVTNITYSVPGVGCYAATSVTVNSGPATITGNSPICVGDNLPLASADAGGTWTSGYSSIATIDGSGTVTGIAGGTSKITYALGPSCRSYAIVTVNALPAPISGGGSICLGSVLNLTCATSGGFWTSDNTSIATVSPSGTVNGVGFGTANISYTLSSTGCARATTITVGSGTTPITGPAAVCVGSTTVLSNATSGGTWSSADPSLATISASTGVVSGVNAGITNVTYSIGAGCQAIQEVTINPLPPAISGSGTVCIGLNTAMTNAESGGYWSSSNTAIATVGSSSGIVTGIAAATATISYTLSTGCAKTRTLTVNPLPATITGSASLCVGATSVLSNSTPGGVSWTSSDNTVATIGLTSGVLTGVAPGTATITYTVSSGCYATRVVTVSTPPAAITGPATVCIGSSISLSSATSGGTWSEASYHISVDGAAGVVTGISEGIAAVTYTVASCSVSTVVTVLPLPATISGSLALCIGTSSTLSCSPTGGTWSSDDISVATVGTSSGLLTGVSFGNSTISYTAPTGCARTTVATINATPSSISGAFSICIGSSTTLLNASSGGTWSSSNTYVATIGSASGVVAGVSIGTVTVTYTSGLGCFVTQVITVSTTTSAIIGASGVCAGETIMLTHGEPGGIWSSGNTSIATVGSTTGVVTGVAGGSATITYAVGAGCFATKLVTVYGAVPAIAGTYEICEGDNTVIPCPSSGGLSWTSSNTSVATVGSSSGLVMGIAAGTAGITFTTTAGCNSSTVVTVNSVPAPITGTLTVCKAATTSLSCATSGGTWTSHTTSKAVIDASTGVVTGVNAGTSTIWYSLSTGCRSIVTVTVYPLVSAGAIVGPGLVHVGSSVSLVPSNPGGIWSSADVSLATVGSSSGVLTGVSVGNVYITYTVTGDCGTAFVRRRFIVAAPRPGSPLNNTEYTVLRLYPNPASDIITVEAPLPGTLVLLGIDGKEVGIYNLESGSTELKLPTGIASGAYLCRFSDVEGNSSTFRITIIPK